MKPKPITMKKAALFKSGLMKAALYDTASFDLIHEIFYEGEKTDYYHVNNNHLAASLREIADHLENWRDMIEVDK